MIQFLKDLFRFIWKRDSTSAVILIMDLLEYLTEKDTREIGQYTTALLDNIRSR